MTTSDDRAQRAAHRKQLALGMRSAALELKAAGKSNAEIASELQLSESTVRLLDEEAPDIQGHETIWFPGVYVGRQGDYAKKVSEVSGEELTALVQKRAAEDGEWAIKNGFVGDNEDKMRKMMAWVSKETNIIQCVIHITEEGMGAERTVDWVCRELANATRQIGGT